MIRRAAPLGADPPRRWLLIPQQEHARLSHAIAAAWGNDAIPPVVCPADVPDHPLAGVRRELLAAIRRHDDGWAAWWDSPGVDPEHGRPYSFTEMPPAEAQRLWRASIAICREESPLAGWVVASHFSALQGKRDADYDEWVDWLAEVDAERGPWLDEWLAASPHHTRELAERCLAWLQAMDWVSLWLCCVCPIGEGDAVGEPLVVGEKGDLGWPRIVFTPRGGGDVNIAPAPFKERVLELGVDVPSVPVATSDPVQLADARERVELRWRLTASY